MQVFNFALINLIIGPHIFFLEAHIMQSALPFQPGTRLFAYLRDSGHEDQDLSIPQQEAQIHDWAIAHQFIISRIYKDEAKKGSSVVGRAALQEMMNAFRHHCAEAGVVVWKYNRFARNVDNAQFFRAEMRNLGYVFYSLNDNIPDGPAGRVFEALIDYKDEQFLLDLSIDVKRGLRDLVQQHGCVPGMPPRGLRREPVNIGNRRDGTPHFGHKWVPDPETAPLVKQAFEMRAAGASLGEIHAATRLYGSISSYATCWSNKIYIGTLKFSDLTIENYCDPIVTTDVWLRVQEIQKTMGGQHRVASNTTDHPRRQTSRFLLSGIANCARCGAPLFGHSSKQRNGSLLDSYVCTGAYRLRNCTRHRIPRHDFEQAVIATFQTEILRGEILQRVYDELQAAQKEIILEQDTKHADINQKLSNLRRQIKNITNAIMEHGHSKNLLDNLSDLEREQLRLLNEQAKFESLRIMPVPNLSQPELQERSDRIIELLKTSDQERLRTILRALIAHVDVDRNSNQLTGTIYYYYPPPLFILHEKNIMIIPFAELAMSSAYQYATTFSAQLRYHSQIRQNSSVPGGQKMA